MQPVGAPSHRRRTQPAGVARCKIAVKQIFEAHQYVFIDPFASDELPVIETCAVIQEQFDGGGYDGIAVAVRPAPYLIIYLFQAVDDGIPLLQ